METKEKTYRMLNTAQGSRDGLKVETFNKGETYDLNPELAEQFYHQGAIEEVGGHPANARAKKVTGPAETKEGEAGVDLDTQNIEELVALARDTYGLDVDSTMSEDDLKTAIREAVEDATKKVDLARMSKVDLVTYAKSKLGMDLVPDSMTKTAMIEAIEAHAASK